MNYEIRPVSDLSSFQKIAELQKRAWGFGDLDVAPGHVLQGIVKSEGQVLAAFDGSEVVGCAIAFAGFDSKSGKRYLLSHMVAVKPELQSHSLGYSIKLEQRKIALGQGINIIKWTYDPLITKNANINIRKLGARVYKFNPNEYGEIKSELYGNLPTDRFEVTWDLTDPKPIEYPENAPHLIEMKNGKPAVNASIGNSQADFYFCSVPLDHLDMRKENPALARDWQFAIREVSTSLLDGRYCVSGFRICSDKKSGEYLFSKL